MLAKVVPPTNDFYALARYLVHGKGKHPHPDRVAWTRVQNLPTDDPELAAKFMTATAELSARTKHAAYHTIIGWHPDERPTPEQMQQIAFETLKRAGLSHHQALIMGHGDANHPHLHMLINRVNPDTGRAWSTSHDYARLDKIMAELSDEFGYRHTPAHTYNPDATRDQRRGPNSKAFHASKRGAATLRPQWSRTESYMLGVELSDQLELASTVDDVADLLAERGLGIEAKGQGFVVGDDGSYAKLSSLHLTCSSKAVARLHAVASPSRPIQSSERRLKRSLFHVDGVDIARVFYAFGLLTKDDVKNAIEDARTERVMRQSDRRSLVARLSAETMLTRVAVPSARQSPRTSLKPRTATRRRGR